MRRTRVRMPARRWRAVWRRGLLWRGWRLTAMWIFARRHDCPHTPQEFLVHPAGAQQAFTVVGADGGLDVELALEPNANPAGRTFQTALFEQNIPATAFEVDDIQSEYRRLKGLGVVFSVAPTQMGPISIAVFADTCVT